MSERLWLAFAGLPKCGETCVSRDVFYKDFFTAGRSKVLEDQASQQRVSLQEPKDIEEFEYRLREHHGPAALAELAIGGYMNRERMVLQGGLRNRAEAYAFKKEKGKVVALWCPFDVRYERALLLAMANDSYIEPEDFHRDELHLYDNPDPLGCQIIAVMQEADYHIYTDRPRSNVLGQVLGLIQYLEAA